MEKARIMIVEDESIITMDIERMLQSLGYEIVSSVTSGEEAIIKAEEEKPDLVIVDIILSGEINGIEASKEIGERLNIPIIYLTAHADADILQRARETEPYGYILKPVSENDLYTTIVTALQRHSLETELERSKEQYRSLVENITDVIYILDKGGNITYISPVIEQVSHYKVEELMGMNFTEFIHPDDLPGLIESYNRTIKGQLEPSEFRIFDKDGSVRYVRTSSRIIEKDGEVVGLRAIMTDITERKLADEALRESKEKYQLLAEGTTDVIWTTDMKLKNTYCSPSVIQLFGYTPEEMLTQSMEDIITPASLETVKAAFFEVMKGIEDKPIDLHISRVMELEIKHKDGSIVPVELAATLMRDKNGKPVGVHGIIRNIAERKRSEIALQESERRYRELIENINEVIYSLDENGTFTYISPVVETFGYTPSEVIGKNFTDFVYDEDVPRIIEGFKRSISNDHKPSEYRVITKSGDIRWVRVSDRTIYEGDKPKGVQGVLSDITERREAEEALKQRNIELELLNYASRALFSTLKIDSVLAVILEEVRRLLNVVASSIWLVDSGTDELVCFHATGPQKEIVRGWRLKSGEGIAGWVALHGESLIVEDTRIDERHFKGVDSLTGLDLNSILCIPLKTKKKIIGVLQVSDTEVSRFNNTHLKLLEPLSAYASIAVENARLFEEAQQEIIERKRAEEEIKSSIREKDILLKEIHHRVKNNMQLIKSLLNLQSRKIKDEELLELFEVSQNRIRAIAYIHEKLYQSKDFSRIDFSEYIRGIARELYRLYVPDPNRVTLHIEFDSILLDINKAIPCGLALNELITNAFKHAFPPDWKDGGEVRISIPQHIDDNVKLVVSDNGIGIPGDMNIEKTETLGLQLVNMLIKDQLDGDVELNRDKGTRFTLTFKK